MMMLLLACTLADKNEDTASSHLDDSAVEIEEIDLDNDGYPDWRSTTDIHRADCDDSDPNITPNVERYIPAGVFIRGENDAPFTSPQQEIYLSDYCLDVYEVRNDDFVEYLIAQLEAGWDNQTPEGLPLFDFADDDDIYPERIERTPGSFQSMLGYENHPVTEVWQWSAQGYCAWAGKRLPTEAQWEKGARGEDGRSFPWGEEEPSCALVNFGTMESQCIGDTVEVGSYPEGASPYGLLDMSGNVAEFVNDWFLPDYYSDSPFEDPTGPEEGFFDDGQGNQFQAIIARSGNHATGKGDLQTFFRQPEPFDATSNGIGFRCGRDLSWE